MPVVTKQKATPAPRKTAVKTGGIHPVLDRIVDVTDDNDGLRVSVYGRGKTGKTRFACTFPKPLLLIGTEKGTRSVVGIKGVKYVPIYHSEELDPLTELLRTGAFKTVGLDTAGGLQDMVLKEVLGLEELPLQRSWGMCKREDWATCGLQTKERLRQLLVLSESHGIHVVIIAHERNFNDEGASDVLFPTVGAALTPSVTGWLNGATDYICQTYIREQVESKQQGTVGGKGIKLDIKTGKKEYCLRVGPHPVFQTGFRLPPGRELPESIVDPTYDKIRKLISG